MRTRLALVPLLLALIIGSDSVAQGPNTGTPGKAGEVVVEAATVKAPDGKEVRFELGTLHVPENRSEPGSRLIGVGFARFKADPASQAPPIFLLPGGPGGSYLDDFRPGSAPSGLMREILRYRGIGDVVLVDQRGFSMRGEVLKHRFRTRDEPLDQPASLERSTRLFVEMARGAVAALEKRGIDLRGYTVKECADDVDDLRRALGYERVMLVGTSFGSQWSFAVMRRHPDRVARALLSGVEPLDCGYDMPSHILTAIQRMWREAEQHPQLKPYVPPGGLMAAAREVLRRLKQEPIKVSLKRSTETASAEMETVTLGHEDFQKAQWLRTMAGPEFVLTLYHGHYEQWAHMTRLARRSRTAEFPMIAGLIDTSLGVTPGRLQLLRNDPAIDILGQWAFDNFLATADIWPSPDVGDDFRTEVACAIPVVFVHGDWDTLTPVENVLQVAPYFRNGHVLLVERGGHGAMHQLAQHLPDVREALLGFLKDGRTENLPVRVSIPAPAFGVPNFPPPKP